MDFPRSEMVEQGPRANCRSDACSGRRACQWAGQNINHHKLDYCKIGVGAQSTLLSTRHHLVAVTICHLRPAICAPCPRATISSLTPRRFAGSPDYPRRASHPQPNPCKPHLIAMIENAIVVYEALSPSTNYCHSAGSDMPLFNRFEVPIYGSTQLWYLSMHPAPFQPLFLASSPCLEGRKRV